MAGGWHPVDARADVGERLRVLLGPRGGHLLHDHHHPHCLGEVR
eukprot:CAMPEP_0167793866 /NCGR_PEP_ID=MMETSP0111_2-20121227/13471_1 /TAXON_ID=91324 /ORGANISM="Lotharella globosa, Strain CCCM811" /LENGTH=43 /DNA_ID= /DNA_START= /DNA_END= /DNA_ORIENTATION=